MGRKDAACLRGTARRSLRRPKDLHRESHCKTGARGRAPNSAVQQNWSRTLSSTFVPAAEVVGEEAIRGALLHAIPRPSGRVGLPLGGVTSLCALGAVQAGRASHRGGWPWRRLNGIRSRTRGSTAVWLIAGGSDYCITHGHKDMPRGELGVRLPLVASALKLRAALIARRFVGLIIQSQCSLRALGAAEPVSIVISECGL